jgi:hypothetical protein
MKCGNLAPAIPIAAMIVGAVLSAAPAMAFPVAGRFNGIIDQVSDPVGVIAGSGITIEPGTPFSGTIQYDTWPGGVSTDEDPNPNRGIYRFFVPEERPIPPDWVFGGFSLSIDGGLLSTNVSRDPVEIQVTNDLLSGGVLIDRFVFPINGFMRVLGSEPLPGLFPKGPLVLSQRGDGQPAGTPDLITSDALPTRIGFPAGTEGTLSMTEEGGADPFSFSGRVTGFDLRPAAEVVPVPVPSTLWLLGTGLAVLYSQRSAGGRTTQPVRRRPGGRYGQA